MGVEAFLKIGWEWCLRGEDVHLFNTQVWRHEKLSVPVRQKATQT